MVKIFIEGYELDVMQDFSHQITYAIDDIRNLDSKATTFTKTIVLPGTANNNSLLGNIFELSNANFTNDAAANVGYNFNAAKSAQARIEINGLQIMKGVMRLMEIIVEGSNIEYEIALFGELGGFINAVGSKKLTGNLIESDDLDFSAYDHDWTIANIEDSWGRAEHYLFRGTFEAAYNRVDLYNIQFTNASVGDTVTISGTSLNNGVYTISGIAYYRVFFTWHTRVYFNQSVVNETISTYTIVFDLSAQRTINGKGYIYPLIDFGNVSPAIPSVSIAKHDYQVKAFRPAFFIREIMEKIISDAGYSFESNFFNTNFFNRLIMPNNDKALINRTTTDYIAGTNSGTYGGSDINGSIPIILTNTTLNNFTYNSTTGIFTYVGTSNIQTKITFKVTGTYYVSSWGAINIHLGTSQGVGLGTGAFGQSGPTTGVFNSITTNTAAFAPGELIEVKANLSGRPRIGWSASATVFVEVTVVKDPPEGIEYLYGQNIQMNNLIPKNIFQKDFFVAILKMFNLYVVEDKQREKHLKIEPYVNYYQTGNYLDWTEKVDRSQPIKIKPMSELASRYYEFKYKQDSDFYNEKYRKTYFEGYGDRYYDNLYEFATQKQTNEVLFSATPLVGYEGEDKVVSTIFKMNNDVEEATDHNIRILQYKFVEDVTSWKIQNDSTTLGTYTGYPYAGHLDDPDLPAADLNFGATKELYFNLAAGALSNNMFNAYYSPYMAEITDKDSRLVTARMKFNEIDMFNLDFSRLIFIDNVVYRLSKIIDYSLGELCNVELLRVINTTYYDVTPPPLELGQEYQGGIIAYLDETGQHGLIKANDPLLDYNYMFGQWSVNYNSIGTTSTDYGEGLNNTNEIIAIESTSCLAYFCQQITSNGYSDWVLPSRDEVSNIWAAGQIPIEFNSTDNIWTSSENDTTTAICISNSDGSQITIDKYLGNKILPVRYF